MKHENITDSTEVESQKDRMVSILEEFNRYRRGEGEYAWNEDPVKNKSLSLSPRVISEAIDYAVNFLKTH